MPACIFCGSEGSLTREHVFPVWSQDLLTSDEGPGSITRYKIRRGQPTEREEYETQPARLTAKSVCADCNNGWMNDLERAARPLLTPLICGRNPVVQPAAAEILATWAVKTALVYGSKGDISAPDSLREEFGAARALGPNTRVWLGRTDRQDFTYADIRPTKVRERKKDPEPEQINAYVALVAIGRVWFYIVSWAGPRARSGAAWRRSGLLARA